jgi:hypothetical protein
MNAPVFPEAVFALWWTGLLLTLVIFVPLAVYLLHRTWRAARSIRRYAVEALEAAGGIAGNTPHVAALDDTIGVATDMLGAAGRVVEKLDTIATVLETRAGRR